MNEYIKCPYCRRLNEDDSKVHAHRAEDDHIIAYMECEHCGIEFMVYIHPVTFYNTEKIA